MPSAENNTGTPNAGIARRSLVARLGALLSRGVAAARRTPLLALVLLCGSAIIVSSGISVGYYLVIHGSPSSRGVTIEAALACLDGGEYDEARNIASQLTRTFRDGDSRSGYPLFVQGAVLAEEASQQDIDGENRILFLIAARYLQEARKRGFPPGREKEGLYLLGSCLFKAGHFAESLPVLHDALKQVPGQKHEIARLLSTAYLRDQVPNLKRARDYSHMWLENPSLTEARRHEALLQLAEIELGLQNQQACRETLSRIPDDSPLHDEALILRGRLLIQESGCSVVKRGDSGEAADHNGNKEKLDAAINVLERAQSKASSEATTGQSQYLLGICYRDLGDPRAAKEAFEQTRRRYYQTPEAFAATLAQGELLQKQDQHDAALSLFLTLIGEVGVPAFHRNDWVSLDQLRERLLAAQKEFTKERHFQSALSMADAFSPLMRPEKTAAAEANTHEQWAKYLLEQADELGEAEGESARLKARRQFRLAAAKYRELAELRFVSTRYPRDLWKSGDCFRRGQNYRLACRMLRKHQENTPRKEKARGWVALGECHLAMGNYHTALGVLNKCIKTFPSHPETYRARLLASHAHRELGELQKAQKLLNDNLHNYSLTPQSRHWKESLFVHGKLLFQQAVNREAAARKPAREDSQGSEAVQQRETAFKDLKASHDLFRKAIRSLSEVALREERAAQAQGRMPDSAEARYYIAESYGHLANLPEDSLRDEPSQSRRNDLREEMRSYLRQAARAHHELWNSLIEKQDQCKLSAIESHVLRNSHFAHANALFRLEEYDEAIDAYADVANRYQKAPAALEALMQIARCYRRKGSTDEARETLLQARAVFSRIPKDVDFDRRTRYNRKEWKKLIDWLAHSKTASKQNQS
ncbi:MAG: tetratricopeptide repeat protein [Planctomycetota bacterium]